MNNPIAGINKEFESRVRLGVMSVLMVNERVDFNTLKEWLGVTDGNLASHAAALEKCGYLTVAKEFVGKKTRTSFQATSEGKAAFEKHLAALENLMKNSNLS